jgi:hypothetical protein
VEPAENVVAVVDQGLYGRALAIGSRLVGDILQWHDGTELHLVRGRIVPESVRRRSFEFERVNDRHLLKFSELDGETFEAEFRGKFPEAPEGVSGAEIRAWLVEHHGLWRQRPSPADIENADRAT